MRDVAIFVLAAVVVAAVVLGFVRFSDSTSSVADKAAAQATTPSASPTAASLPPLVLPDHAKMVVLGDSWADGNGVPPDETFEAVLARQLGWKYRLIADGLGTGYLHASEKRLLFDARLGAEPVDPTVDVLLIQGSVNDSGDFALLDDQTMYNTTVERVFQIGRERYPNAVQIVLGPLYQITAAPSGEVLRMDDRLKYSTNKAGAYYVSPTAEKWFPDDATVHKYIDHKLSDHPSPLGHAYMASRIADDLRTFAEQAPA